MIDDAIEELTKLLIEQDLKEKNEKKIEMVCISKVELIKRIIKFLKLIK